MWSSALHGKLAITNCNCALGIRRRPSANPAEIAHRGTGNSGMWMGVGELDCGRSGMVVLASCDPPARVAGGPNIRRLLGQSAYFTQMRAAQSVVGAHTAVVRKCVRRRKFHNYVLGTPYCASLYPHFRLTFASLLALALH